MCGWVVQPGFCYFPGEEKLFLCLPRESPHRRADTFLRRYPRPQGNGLALPGFRRAPGKGRSTGDCLGWKSLSGKERWGWGQWEGRNCPSAEPHDIWISGNIRGESAAAPKSLVLAGPLSRRKGSSSRTENCLLKWELLISCTVWLHHMMLRCPAWIKKAAGYCGIINSGKLLHTHGSWSILDGRSIHWGYTVWLLVEEADVHLKVWAWLALLAAKLFLCLWDKPPML